MENQEKIIQEEMRKLIKRSCDFKEFPSSEFRNFHTAFLKFFFGVIEIDIDYEARIISLWNSKPITEDPVRLYDLNEAVVDKVSYNNLEETLKGCLEKGSLQNRFYKNLLFTYNNVSGELDGVLSA